MSVQISNHPEQVPDVAEGIDYWNKQEASYDGVLELSKVPSAYKPLQNEPPKRIRALDVGAGVGRVTSDTLLPLVDDVVLLEPVTPFVQQALKRARESASPDTNDRNAWPGLKDGAKSVTILQGTLQEFDPLNPHRVEFLDRVGYQPARPADDIKMGFDVIWCQWCLGHLSDEDLVAFFVRCRAALKTQPRALVVVKENLCSDLPGPKPLTVFDDQDSSLTRSDLAWKELFTKAGLKVIREKVQEGLPEGLYAVKMYALR